MSGGPIVFVGTGDFAVPALKRLVKEGERVLLAVTQPDRPKGRGRALVPTPVKAAALELGVEVFAPEKINSPESIARISSLAPEFLVVVDYGQILKKEILSIAPGGALNIHPSLLPLHRGPSPVAWAILSGDRVTGVTTMLMDEGMDSGPILMQHEVPFGPEQTLGSLSPLLAQIGSEMIAATLRGLREGSVLPRPQDHARATFSKMIDKSLQMADFSMAAPALAARVNALSPTFAVRGRIGGRLVKLLAAKALSASGKRGGVIAIDADGFAVACGEGAILVKEVLPEGKGAMSAADFARGGAIKVGDEFEAFAP